MTSRIKPHNFIALRLPSGTHKVFKIIPDTTVSLGKYGSFSANSILQKPYYLTFEILESAKSDESPPLRIVPAVELHAESIIEEASPSESRDEAALESYDRDDLHLLEQAGQDAMRNNRSTIDDASRQTLTFDQIEELKKAETGSGKDIIAKIMQSHSALDEKTAYSLAKYTLRKTKKFMRRFTVLPVDVSMLLKWMIIEKDPPRVLEIREEALALMLNWANLRMVDRNAQSKGRWLVIDDTSGLVVAAIAEKLGILYAEHESEEYAAQASHPEMEIVTDETNEMDDIVEAEEPTTRARRKGANSRRHLPDAMSATENTITLVHAANEPNISLLSYFGYVPNDTSSDSHLHPLHTHLRTISWLQVLSPELDTAYHEPEVISDDVLASWKSGKRGTYFRKRRRWERTKRVADETRAGGFDGLIVASVMVPESVLRHTVPLLAGGAQICVYSATVEPLVDLVDSYSSARKTAFLTALNEGHRASDLVPSDDFPVDPRLLLAPTLQTIRAREWQVLPGRTHPIMTARGGAEGFLFTATRVLPATGRVEARGKYSKKRKVDHINDEDMVIPNGSPIVGHETTPDVDQSIDDIASFS